LPEGADPGRSGCGPDAIKFNMTDDLKKIYGDYWTARLGRAPSGENEIFETALSVLKPGGSLLDAGCGDGAFLKLAAPLFGRVCGTDISEPAVGAVRALGLEAVQGELPGPLPFPGGTFDACVLLDVIEHIADPLAALKELRRVLKPGGRLVLSTPNIRCFRHIYRLVFSGEFPRTTEDDFVWGGGHLHYFARKDVTALIGRAGFSGPEFALNPGQFGRSLKRRLLRLAAGERLFGEFVEGSIIAVCVKGDL